MTNNQEPHYNRVIAYIRKSSEDNERGEAHKQLNSLEYQRQFVKDAIARHNLKLVHSPFVDDKTGYEAFVRDGFQAMMEYLDEHSEEVDGIVCTEISRLARNFGDGGLILWNMQKGVIKRIYTYSKVFTNSSTDQMMVAIEFAMSKKSSDDTGDRTKLGMKTKAQNMKHPARPAILGYMTQGVAGAKKWIVNPETGPLVKQVFEQFASGNYTLEEIAEYAFTIGLKSSSYKNKTGKFSKNTWRNRLKDLQYTGLFFHEGEKIVGKYEPLIPSDLFYEVQQVFESKQHPKSTHIDYAYTGMVACPNCGDMMSGTHKKGLTYYRCGKKKSPCKSIKRITYIRESKLEMELINQFELIEIDQEAWLEAREYIQELNEPEKAMVRKQIISLSARIEEESRMQIDLGRQYAKGEYSKEEYNRLMDDSRQKEASLRNTLVKCENVLHELEELMYKFLDDVRYITKRFRVASPENKRELVTIFGAGNEISGWVK